MAWYDDHNAIVILPQAVGATDSAALESLQTLRAKYEEQGIKFFLINPGLQTDRDAVRQDLAALGTDLLDLAHTAARPISLHQTPLSWLQADCRGACLLGYCEAAWWGLAA